jgi:hypothetical protein
MSYLIAAWILGLSVFLTLLRKGKYKFHNDRNSLYFFSTFAFFFPLFVVSATYPIRGETETELPLIEIEKDNNYYLIRLNDKGGEVYLAKKGQKIYETGGKSLFGSNTQKEYRIK